MLSDEALEQLDRELDDETAHEGQLGVTSTGVILNGTGKQETQELVSYF